MTTSQTVIAVIVYLILPLAGLIAYGIVVKRMSNQSVEDPPHTELFLIFSHYGNALLICLIALFLPWSGMATLGVLYMFFVAPIVMAVAYYQCRKTQELSKYHKMVVKAAKLYVIVMITAFWLLLLAFSLKQD